MKAAERRTSCLSVNPSSAPGRDERSAEEEEAAAASHQNIDTAASDHSSCSPSLLFSSFYPLVVIYNMRLLADTSSVFFDVFVPP